MGGAVDLVALEGGADGAGRPGEIHGLEVRHRVVERSGGGWFLQGHLVHDRIPRTRRIVAAVNETEAELGTRVAERGEIQLHPLPGTGEIAHAQRQVAPVESIGAVLHAKVGAGVHRRLEEIGELGIGAGQEVEDPPELQRAIRVRGQAVQRGALRRRRADVRVGGREPFAAQPRGQAGLEAFDPGHRLHGQGLVGDGHVIDEPPVVRIHRIRAQDKPDAQIRDRAPRQQTDLLHSPGRALAFVGPIQPRPPAAVGRDLNRGPVTGGKGIPIPEAQHGPGGADQVHRDQGVGFQVGSGGGTRTIGQAVDTRRGIDVGQPPGSGEDPTVQPRLETVGEGQRMIEGAHTGLRRGGQAVSLVGVHHEDPVIIEGVEDEAGVGERAHRPTGYHPGQHTVEAHVRRGGASNLIATERAVADRGPAHAQGMRGDLVQNRGGHGRRGFGNGDVVHRPAVRHVSRVRTQAEPRQHRRYARVRGKIDPLAPPPIGCPGEAGQGGPVGTGIDGQLGIPLVAGCERVAMLEAPDGVGGGGQAHRRGEGKRLRADVVDVVGAGGIHPGTRRRGGGLGRNRPGWIGHPGGRPPFGVVQPREVHARRRGHGALGAERVQVRRVQRQDAVNIGALGPDRGVDPRGGGAVGDLRHRPHAAPILAGGGATQHPVGLEPSPAEGAPAQGDAVGENAGRRLQGHGGGGCIQAHIVHRPAVADHTDIGGQAEPDA